MNMIIPNDVLTILEDFIEAHPDFSYRGARGTIAVTGYNGIFGYRTSDYWYADASVILCSTKRSTIGTLPLQLCPMKCKLYSNMILPLKPEYSTVL